MSDTHPARRLWLAIEPIHAVTYFDDSCREAAESLGMKGFWMGYFAFRAAPLGPVGPAPVEATFAGFRPQMVARALPDAWACASPGACLDTRAASAASALAAVGVGAEVAAASALLEPVAAGLAVTGRPLAAANQVLPLPDEPVARLWQLATTLREHRGDGHVAATITEGLSGFDAHLLQVAAGEARWGARGWTDDERAAGEASLRDRGLLDGDGRVTAAGAAARSSVEARTDHTTWAGGLAALGEAGVDEVVAQLATATQAAAGLLSFPNPMGLPGG